MSTARAMSGAEPGGIDRRFVRALIEHSADMVSVIAADGTLVFHYPPSVLGYEPGENLGRGIFEFVHPEDVETAIGQLSLALQEPGVVMAPFECRIKKADGSWTWMEIVGRNLIDDPEVGGLVINGHDITDRKRAVEALRHSEERFRALVQHSSDIIAVVSVDATLLYASPSSEAVLGYPAGELVGRTAFELLHPDDYELAMVTLGEAIENPESHPRLELRVRHADGSWRNIEYQATNRLDDPAVGGVVLNGRDVTDRRLAADMEHAQNERFRALVQHGSDIIVVLDAGGDVQYVSPSVRHLMGYEPEDLRIGIGGDIVHPDDHGPLTAHYAAVLATPGYHGPYELRARHKDGSWRWLEVVHTNLLDDPAVEGVILNFRDITERKEVEEQLAHQAVHDSLTGLPNRVLLADRLDHALARAERDATNVGVVFLDLDRFKLVNDTRGHVAGDSLLTAAAERLSEVTRAGDTVARFGGDEFVVVHEGIDSADELLELGTRLCEVMSDPFDVDGSELHVTISVGLAIGHSGCSAEVLLRDADAAMYHAKERGGGAVVAFDESIRARAQNRFDTERALRTALDRGGLDVAYQPMIDLKTGRIFSVEALLRWDDPERGEIMPGEFIELAEETGLIVPIGSFVLERACAQVAEWRAIPGAEALHLSVNVSPVQLLDEDLKHQVRNALTGAGLPAETLTLEITESLLIEDSAACLDRLHTLKGLGIRLSVDDFGTRYSSLGYLNRMPLDGMKIDRTFVHRLGGQHRDSAIVSAIVAMAEGLDLWVVAEGIESEDQRKHLLELGCRYGQGFMFAKPERAEAVECLVRAGTVQIGDAAAL